jgi:serine/threonine protein kinase
MPHGDLGAWLSPGALVPGALLGRYELTRLISVGGMAEIYLARSGGIAGFEKRVVVKRILPHFAGRASYVEMFLAEARLAALLDHPNIVHVYDIGESTGYYYYAMEYVEGVDLRAIVLAERQAGRQVPLPAVTAIGRGLCAGLDHAHNCVGPDGKLLGVVHRDVSLANVLVSYDGSVKVTDFGVATVSVTHSKTRAVTFTGKRAYMSPEQCRGESLDRRSDVFAIGIVLWELIVGRRLLGGESDFNVLRRIVDGDVTRPSAGRADLPGELEAIVMKALAPARADRYQSARELQRDLEAFARERRLGISDLELGEYMSGLFPPEQRGIDELGVVVAPSEQPDLELEAEEAASPPGARPASTRRMPALEPGPHPAAAPASVFDVIAADAAHRAAPPRGSSPSPPPVLAPRGTRGPDPSPGSAATRQAKRRAILIGGGVGLALATAIIVAAWPGSINDQPMPLGAAPALALAPRHTEPTSGALPALALPLVATSLNASSAAHAPGVRGAPARLGNFAGAAPSTPRPPAISPGPQGPPAVAAPSPSPAGGAPAPQLGSPAAPVAGSLDAVPSLGAVDVDGSLQPSVVRRGLEQVILAYRQCYRNAARGAGRTPALTVQLAFEIDETGAVHSIRAKARALPGLSTCLQDATARVPSRIAPDVGGARGKVTVTFSPTTQ